MNSCPFYRPHLNWCAVCLHGPCKIERCEKLGDVDKTEFRAFVYLLDGFGTVSVVDRIIKGGGK